jgi:hypothetical protein
LDLEQTLEGGLAQPQVKRHRPTPQEVPQTLKRLQMSFLDDIGRINARTDAGVEAQLDELAQAGAEQGEQALERLPVPCLDLLQQQNRLC